MRLVGVFVCVAACGGAIRGERDRAPAAAGPTVSSSTTSAPGGVRVLHDGRAAMGKGAWLATTPEQLGDLWRDAGESGDPPAIDFTTHVVIAHQFMGGACMSEITGAHVDARGTLVLDEAPFDGACIDLLVSDATIVAIPRALVGARFTWRIDDHEAYTFDVPAAPAAAPRAAPPTPPAELAGGMPRGGVVLPPAGHLALRALFDGRAIWVVHRTDGDVSVLLADRATGRANVRAPVVWDPKTGRFDGAYDSRGRSIHGDAPLEALAFAKVADGTRIAIGEVAPIEAGAPIEARADAPALDGGDTPYKDLTPVPFAQVPPGHFARVAEDLVAGVDGPPRVCTLPEGKLRQYLPGCPDDAPAILGGVEHHHGEIDLIEGPLIVHRRDHDIDLVIGVGNGTAGWVVEHHLHAPAPRGETRARGALALGSITQGDTDGAKDGFTPPCIPREAAGGPDEAWQLTAIHTATYAIELDSDHDAVLAVTDDRGNVLACNDDKHGYYRASVVHVPLVAGTKARVIVDAFDRAPQRYTLRAREERPRANGGVLALGVPVSDDTTDAIDDHATGCAQAAPDHTYTLDVADAGVYAIRIEAKGWDPAVELLRGDRSIETYVSVSPLEIKPNLEPGTYTIVVDGCSGHGPYTLRVDQR
jgi:hypothetical protein